MKIVIIAAIAPGGVIGRSKKRCPSGATYDEECDLCCGTGFVSCNELPWPPRTYPEDMEHFKTVTMGHAVVMGRNTWESIPERYRPLPGRTNIVVSTLGRTDDNRGIAHGVYGSLDAARHWLRLGAHGRLVGLPAVERAFVIGGARLYAEALPVADELDLTLVSRKWDGDVTFPGWRGFVDGPDGACAVGSTYRHGSPTHDTLFELVSREPCPTNPDLTFTKWVRR